jgi:hypothetical protein
MYVAASTASLTRDLPLPEVDQHADEVPKVDGLPAVKTHNNHR